MPLFYAVDRFDGPDWVVLENDAARTFSVPRSWLPANIREGDVVTVAVDPPTSSLRILVDAEATASRLHEVVQLRGQLPRGPKGDVSL